MSSLLFKVIDIDCRFEAHGTSSHEHMKKFIDNAEHSHKMHFFSSKTRARVRSGKKGSCPFPDYTALHKKDTNLDSFEADIHTLETMNVEAVTSKIRGECEHLIKELHLEHLAAS